MSGIHLVLLLTVLYGGVQLSHGGSHHSANKTSPYDNSSGNKTVHNMTQTSAVLGTPADKVVDGGDGADDSHRSLFMISVLIGFCVFAVLAFSMTVVCWVRVFSQPKKGSAGSGGSSKEAQQQAFKTKDTERLDTQNMRDVQLTEYEKRKRQMKELDSQESPARQQDIPESEDDDENDEITAVQSQPPLDEETIVNPNFIHHFQFRHPYPAAGSG